MDADDLIMIEKALAAVLEDGEPAKLTEALDDFGWINILTEAMEAVPVVFRALGRSKAWSSALHDVLYLGLLADVGDASLSNTSVIVPLPGSLTPGVKHPPHFAVDGLLLGARSTTAFFVAACEAADGEVLVVQIPRDSATVDHRVGLDVGMDMRRITATADAGMVIARGDPARSWWTTSVSLARRAISVQMCGLLATMLDMARLHAIDRHQFGRPVGSFQAIRHKLAEAAVALAAAEGVADAAWESDDQPLASLVSKVVVSRACTTVAAHTQQVLAGMGFTADHSYHQVMKRAVVLDRLFGDANELLPVLGRQLMARGAAPRLVEL